MATTKIWKVDSHLRRVVDYAKNENKTINPDWEKSSYQAMEDVMNYAADDLKTEQKFYVSGINCVPERAREMMMQTKEQYQKTGGILAWHGYQSFAEGEVDASTAHEIGIKLAEELWPDFEVIVATHLNTKCFHNHFVVNSVSFLTGNKFNAWAAQKKERRDALYVMAHEMADAALTDTSALADYLGVQAKLGKTSVVNSLLVAAQKPEASFIRSFEDWQKHGRSVMKGEKGIDILTPSGEYERADGSTGMGFDVKRVFDVSQTQGSREWKRNFPTVKSAIKALMTKSPVPIVQDDTLASSIGAHYSQDRNAILVARNLENKDLFFTVARELARADGCDNTFLCDCAANIACLRYGIEPRLPDAISEEYTSLDNRDKRDALSIIRDTACDMVERIDHNLQAERNKNEPER